MIRLKQRLSALAVAGTLLGTALVAGVAIPASAHTPAASATCEALTVTAASYETQPERGTPTKTVDNPNYKPAVPAQPAVGTPTIVIDNPAYVPATPGSPAVGEPKITVNNPNYVAPKPAVTKTEYKYLQYVTGKEKWLDSKTWNPGLGWYYAHETRVIEVTPAVPGVGTPTIVIDNPNYKPAVPPAPAQGEPKIEVTNPDYKPAVPAQDAVGTPKIEVENPDYRPADATPNTATVTINGVVVETVKFGKGFSKSYTFANKYQANSWSVSFVSWNGPGTKTESGTSTACPLPEQPKDKVNYGTWSNPVFDCTTEVGDVQQVTRTNIRTPYVFDYESGKWVLGTPVSVETHKDYTATAEDVAALDKECAPEQPKDLVVPGEWSTAEFDCTTEVGDEQTITREVSTTVYVLEGREWVEGETSVTTEEKTYVATAEDIEGVECPVEEPPVVTPPATETPKPTPAPVKAAVVDDSLAATGGELPLVLGGLGVLALIAGGVVIYLSRRKKATEVADSVDAE